MGVEFPQNDFTRMIEAVSSGNRAGTHRVGVASATPLPTVQSADLGREVPEDRELTPEERAELDRRAIEAGVHDKRLGNAEPAGEADGYATLEEAMAAGAPVNPPPTADPTIERTPVGMHRVSLQGPVRTIVQPRLPDFRKVEGIDLVHHRVILDGMDFPITDEQAAEFKQFVVEVARNAITDRLNEAVGLFATPVLAEEPNGGSTSEMPEVRIDGDQPSESPGL